MKIYSRTNKPTKYSRALKVWEYAVNTFGNGYEPLSMWYNPYCFGKVCDAFVGFWMVRFDPSIVDTKFCDVAGTGIPIHPSEVK